MSCRQGLGLRSPTTILNPKPVFVQIQLYGDVPTGSARFADLAKGIEGVGYKRSKVDFVNAVRQESLRAQGLGLGLLLTSGRRAHTLGRAEACHRARYGKQAAGTAGSLTCVSWDSQVGGLGCPVCLLQWEILLLSKCPR